LFSTALLQHPVVADCAGVSGPGRRPRRGHKAAVVLAPNGEQPDDLTAELRAWVKSRYGARAPAATVEVLDALPRTPSGKVKRFELRG
jgi:acetyl-CoA synthetase